MSKTETKIAVFVCNWDGLSCMEAAAQHGHCYPASVKIVRVTCLSRIHLGLILKAFELGAEGVMLMGCEPGNCHYDTDSALLIKECEKARNVLRLLGIEEKRLTLSHLPRGDGYSFVRLIADFVEEIEQIKTATPART